MSESSFIKEENQRSGQSAWQSNLRLFRSLPLFLKFFPLSLVFIALSSAAPSVFRWYSGRLSAGDPHFTLTALAWLTVFAIFFRISAWMTFEMTGMWASQRIHHQMVKGLAHTRTTYFDENPSGRLINRLIRDYDEVRSTAIIFVGDLLNAVIEVLSIAVVAAFASPIAGFLIFPLLLIFSYIQKNRSEMLSHSRSLSAVATSHVLARETDLIEGREIFLLYGKAHLLLKRMKQSFRLYLQASALGAEIEAWGSFWIRFSAETFSFLVMLLVAYAIYTGKIDSTLAGVIISSLFGVTASIGWLDFATSLISRSVPHVERVFEIVDLPHEESEERKEPARSIRPIPVFDQIPDLEFKNYTMSYRKDSPIILDHLNLRIEGGKRTALMGRTGSGKTSLTQALLRMVYVHGGDILMGGQSIFEMDVRELRKLFGVIPQSPYLFAGDLRANLDLTGTLSTEVLQKAIDAVQLKFSLDHPVQEGGQNLSQGERQLVCLARVIAANKPFIIMDEATSGLDPETDARVTYLLKHELAGKTLITIAHRAETVQNYDSVIRLSHGKLI
jgi:ABC-type multidrug transport system fused ATPase/permease subunit